MTVVDASAMVEALVGADPDPRLFDALAGELHAPHLLDYEVQSVLRGLALSQKLGAAAADLAREDYAALSITRYECAPLADRMWQLRHHVTSYDAAYLALAEALGAPLVTCDRKLRTAAPTTDILLVPLSG